MEQISLAQGSPQWHAHRRNHWNASDAPAMMGCSPYETRSQLLHRIATGIEPEIDAATQRRFDDGHRAEALARPLAESIIGEDLFPVVGTNGRYSASFDGLTMDETTAFEHKTLNESLRYDWDTGNGYHLPKMYQVQMEHQLIVSGADRVLFMATRWDGDVCVEKKHCWYASDPALRHEILAGWRQFESDLAAYMPTEAKPAAPVGRAPETLPALRIEVSGAVSASNLADFKAIALGAIRSVNRELKTDQHFADAEQAVKWCGEVEDKIKAAKAHALSQTATIDELFRTLDDISAEARTVRLELDKLVKDRKAVIKVEMVSAAKAAYEQHEAALRQETGGPWILLAPPDFGAAIKGLRSIDSMQDAIDAAMAGAKIRADESARKIRAALAALDDESKGFEHLFADRLQFISKPADDVRALVRGRIAEHRAAEQKRAADLAEQERERIRAEEAARAQAEVMKPAPAAPVRLVQPPTSPAPVTSVARIKLGDINARIAPLSITADGLASLGFSWVATDKASKLYRESDFGAICAALIYRIESATASLAA